MCVCVCEEYGGAGGAKPVCVLVYMCVRGRSLYTYEKGVWGKQQRGRKTESSSSKPKMAH